VGQTISEANIKPADLRRLSSSINYDYGCIIPLSYKSGNSS